MYVAGIVFMVLNRRNCLWQPDKQLLFKEIEKWLQNSLRNMMGVNDE